MPQKLLDDPRVAVPAAAAVLLECDVDSSALAALRGELSRHGAGNGLTGVALTHFVLAVNEIVTNAVRYAGGHGRVCLSRHADELWCVVTDDGPGIPRRCLDPSARRGPDQIGGQGIWLAQRICVRVHIETGRARGTRVVLRFALRGGTA
jgi:anti-sigma regulatory factor (Ser/Thr protein kinase)